ncbi:MAG: SDR family oxidoreductase [Thermoleophilia bacterium]
MTARDQVARLHVLVTGATGTVGSEIVNQLRVAGVRVRAVSHYADRTAYSHTAANEYVEVDFRRPETLATAFSGIDKVVIVTPETADMADMTAHLVKAAEHADVRLISGCQCCAPEPGLAVPC